MYSRWKMKYNGCVWVFFTFFCVHGCGNDETQFSSAKPKPSEQLEEQSDGGSQATTPKASADATVKEPIEKEAESIIVELEPEPLVEELEAPPLVLPPVMEKIEDQKLYLAIDQFSLKATLRDFKDSHPDMERYASGVVKGLVLPELGADRLPVLNINHPKLSTAISSEQAFNQWYRDVPGVNEKTEFEIPFTRKPNDPNVFYFEDLDFFPLDGKLFGNQNRKHNYHFTLELHTTFFYRGGERFEFTGDDDVWMYIDGKLAVDIGGTHSSKSDFVELDTLGLEKGKRYRFDFFFAERKTTASRFKIETSLNFSNQQLMQPIKAQDPAGLELQYRKILGPEGLKVDPITGQMIWEVGEEDLGIYQVIVAAENSLGMIAEQEFLIEVLTR